MRVYRRPGSPSYYVDLVSPDGKRIRRALKTTSLKEAKALAAEMAVEVNRDHAKPGSPIRLSHALDDYIDIIEAERSPGYAANCASLRDKLLGRRAMRGRNGTPEAARWHLDPSRDLDSLTPMDIANLVKQRRAEGIGPGRIGLEISLLRATVARCRRLGYRVPQITDWQQPAAPEKTRYLSWEEYEQVYAALDPAAAQVCSRPGRQAAQDLLVALVMTGARWGEMANLTWDRVDLDRKQIRLFGDKTGAERIVPISGRLLEVLTRLRAGRAFTTPLVFPGDGGKPRTHPPEAFAAAYDSCGINRPDIVERYGKATTHSLRHTYASWLLQNGASVADVQYALGHATITQTMRYGHLSQSRTLDSLGAALDRATT